VPSRNIIKTYIKGGYYHVYNRGIDKRSIFLDKQDCAVFLHYLKLYLSPIEEIKKEVLEEKVGMRFLNLNLSKEIELLSFALMPNHFHLLLKQNTEDGVTKLLKRLATAYVMYFNKKYNRLGPLFQNIFKACLVETDAYLLHLSRYIHLNASEIKSVIKFTEFSSYPYYLGDKRASWVKPQEILDYFISARDRTIGDLSSYESFVNDMDQGSKEILRDTILEEDCSEE